MFWLPRGGWRDSRTDWQRCLRGREQTDLPGEGAFGFPEFSLRLQDRAPLQAVSAPRMPSVVCWVPLASQGTTLLGRLSCFCLCQCGFFTLPRKAVAGPPYPTLGLGLTGVL